jgi:antitoxin MazE
LSEASKKKWFRRFHKGRLKKVPPSKKLTAAVALHSITIGIIIRLVTKLKIRSIGSSSGVILPKELLDRLNLGEGDELFVTEIGREIRLSPYNPDFDKLMNAARAGVKKYRNALRALAKV